MNNSSYYNMGKCANCGIIGGTVMGSTEWGHNYACCSKECGSKLGEKFEANRRTKRYRVALVAYRKADMQLHAVEFDGAIIY